MDEEKKEEESEKEYLEKLEEARMELSSGFSTPGAKTAEESAERALQKNKILSSFSKEELVAKRHEAKRALGDIPPEEKRRSYTHLERRALGRARKLSEYMREKEGAKTSPPPVNLPGAHIVPPKITPEREQLKEKLQSSPLISQYVSTIKDEEIDSLLEKPIPGKEQTIKDIKVLNEKGIHIKTPAQQAAQPTNKGIKEAIQKEKISLAQIAIEEQKRRRALEESGFYNKKRVRQNIVIALTIIFAMAGTGTILYNAFINKPDVIVPIPDIETEYLITPDIVKTFEIDSSLGESAKERFNLLMFGEVTKQGSIQNIIFVNKNIQEMPRVYVNEALGALEIFPPEQFLRSLEEEYMIGIYSDVSNYAFLVFNIDSFSNALSGMLMWENRTLPYTYNILTGNDLNIRERDLVWKDVFIRNTDVRMLTDNAGDIYLIYSFPNKETLIIAPSKNTFIEILGRLKTPEQILR